MRPPDPEDVVPGWLYEIVIDWRQSRSEEYGAGKDAAEEYGDHLEFAHTLGDAQEQLKLQATRWDRKVGGRFTSPNRWYGSDGEQLVTLRIRAVEDTP